MRRCISEEINIQDRRSGRSIQTQGARPRGGSSQGHVTVLGNLCLTEKHVGCQAFVSRMRDRVGCV